MAQSLIKIIQFQTTFIVGSWGNVFEFLLPRIKRVQERKEGRIYKKSSKEWQRKNT